MQGARINLHIKPSILSVTNIITIIIMNNRLSEWWCVLIDYVDHVIKVEDES